MSRTRRLEVVLLLNLALVTALVVTGLAAHSLAVLAAGADYLADAAAVGVSLLAIWVAARPHGHPRATTVAALVNAGWLLAVTIAIAVAAIGRLAAGTHRVDGLPVLVVSAVAAVVMLAGALILGADEDDRDRHGGDGDGGSRRDGDRRDGAREDREREDGRREDRGRKDRGRGDREREDGGEELTLRAVLLDTAADAAAAAGVAASGAVILGTGGWFWLDPATALAIALIISYPTVKLLRKITRALRAAPPA